ncbi:hypothetical protein [Vallicoccus soli]|uniref:hypothetical protein n=1 Tax=Vallicoccus soli TaxID=2339232 RepID=UPI00140216F7|nr:hypothetical protein [Vallicoccus soli]
MATGRTPLLRTLVGAAVAGAAVAGAGAVLRRVRPAAPPPGSAAATPDAWAEATDRV